ncbi:PTS fructose transporter subunit IIC [Xylanimonas allomyrinae]|uniref:PTS fructose transporter subunit IIC n=1 Tax=Xylanimonas allomyrinae TaxID=2509459 RepID=UPI001FE76FC0|nr:fructose-specific PTS transporter subunit EIIC [Xylanimonas allomyrinae]
MAAEALQAAAAEKGISLRVETQGSIGAEHVLTAQEIADADAVLIAANATVNKDRFIGKRLYDTNVEDGIRRPGEILDRALATVDVYGPDATESGPATPGAAHDPARTGGGRGFGGAYRHLMTGVSYMIPLVVAGGISIALSFAFGGIHAEGAVASAFGTIGSSAFGLMFAVLSGFIAFSIADRPALAAGLIGGFIANSLTAGFLGAVVTGFLAGYVVLAMKKWIKMPSGLSGLLPVLVIPLISSVIVGLVMIFALGKPLTALNSSLSGWLNSISGTNGAILGLILGAMMAIDMAGPIGKAAYFFGVATLTSLSAGQTSLIMAAVMAAGMVPPLAMSLATVIAKSRFTKEERQAGETAWLLGLSFITEGAIPFAAADPLRVLPSVSIGSAVTGALSMLFGCGLAVPHGGLFVLPIPGAISRLPLFLVAIAAGTVLAAVVVSVIKPVRTPAPVPAAV